MPVAYSPLIRQEVLEPFLARGFSDSTEPVVRQVTATFSAS